MNHPRSFRRRRALPALSITRLEDRTVPATLVQPGFAEATMASGLNQPTAMEFSPDGRLFICEKPGTMEIWQDNIKLTDNFFVNAPIQTQTASERGLLGLAFDPDFANNRFIYVYYTTTAADAHNRVSRFTANATGDLALAGSEFVIADLDAHGAGNHNGGAIHFGPDGKLYVATGDNANGASSQDLTTRHGKMLRYNNDGTIPADNPTSFAGIQGTTAGANRAIWAVGLRNPFTFAFQPGTGRMHINDVGQSSFEEINVGGAGLNFGWPATEGTFNQATFPNYTQPFLAYGRAVGGTIAGGAFYNPAIVQFPESYQGDYFYADYLSGWIKSIDLNTKVVTDFATGASGPVDLRVRPDGSLFYLSINSGVARRIYSAPRVTGTVIDDGTAQRSRVASITLSFNTQVNFASAVGAAFTLNRIGAGGGSVGFTANASIVNGVTVVTLTNFTGSQVELSGSLRDGRYTLTGLATQITNGTAPNGVLQLDGDGNGTPGDNFVLGEPQGLFRFFGDVNGDRRVNIADIGIFSLSYLNPTNYKLALDFDGNGSINILDYGQLSTRYLQPLP